MDYELAKDSQGNLFLNVALTDYALLNHPLLNKGTAFSEEERKEFGLIGLLPYNQTNLTIQRQRSYETFLRKPSAIEKYIYLRDLQDSNETLFYNLILEYISEMMPVVYTPVVGLGCQRYSHIYRRPRGLFISYPDRHRIDEMLSNPRFDEVKIIVVSDGERILGLGDQGAGGMGIPIGKLALYTACAGIHPRSTLPILLDSGTNNLELQNDPLYIGWHNERIRGKEYDQFIDDFVTAVKKRFPHVLLHWEDFAQQNANMILNRYQDTLCTFNDDIQGTAAVAAGALLAAIKVTGTSLAKQKVVIFGAGSAGCGIAKLIYQAMIAEGLAESQAKQRIFLVDRSGLLLAEMANLLSFQKPFAQPTERIAGWECENHAAINLKEVIANARPTLLVGTSSQQGAFTEDIIRTMHKFVAEPIIFPLSNPTQLSEATPDQLLQWTDEKAIIGMGSPFDPVIKKGKPFRIDQTNNCYIFPGLGLGLIAVNAKKVTDTMLMAAAKALAAASPALKDPEANILPSLKEIRQVSLQVATAVATVALKEGNGFLKPGTQLEAELLNQMWNPEYLPYKKWKREGSL